MVLASAAVTSSWDERVLRALEVQQEARLLGVEVEATQGQKAMNIDWISVLAAVGIVAAIASAWYAASVYP
jgi:hypothetical protein